MIAVIDGTAPSRCTGTGGDDSGESMGPSTRLSGS
ncbi:hypothetical protein HNR16_000058 [Pseudoclavibacter chungangensis]|nr:hypothetical protein [Pseudoclavibacter chungangensis]